MLVLKKNSPFDTEEYHLFSTTLSLLTRSLSDYYFFKNIDNFLQEKVINNEAAENNFKKLISSRFPEF